MTYGMTETASHIAIRELSGNRRSDFYSCLPGISVDLNEKNCLKIHVPEIAEPIRTNDLALILPDNRFRILGRADSVIISGGIKYQPEAIEKKLEGIINRRFVVSSVPDKKLGEKLVLVIEGEPFEPDHLQEQIKKLLTAYEQPKTILFFKELPETTSGKLKRTEIKNLL